jgi:hypothetical protein
MASSAFPGVFNDVNLRVFTHKERYVHLFDAGPLDNLGLTALRCVIQRAKPAGRILVFIVDAYVAPVGRPVGQSGTRSFVDHFIDSNAFDSIDIMFEGQRKTSIDQLKAAAPMDVVHFTFQDLAGSSDENVKRIYDVANGTPTNLKIEAYEATCLKLAARMLVSRAVQRIRSEPAGKGLADLIPAGNTYAPDLTKVADCQIPKVQPEVPAGG